jgi:aminoglycoside phosphotransferase (APT) family kinase protein
MHGDYSGGNVLFAFDRPGRVAAVVDWENSTIGDPLLDVASFLRPWRATNAPRPPEDPDNIRYSDLDGMPIRQELLARWEQRTGQQAPDLTYYEVLGRFRTAIVLEGSYTRYARGLSTDPYHARFAERVPKLLAGAASLIAQR